MAHYTFGDDDRALERLRLVADAYAPVSGPFVARHLPAGAATVLDLGCGPGFSTELLARHATPGAVLGLDASAPFLDVARSRVPAARFVLHDVTTVPLPGAPAHAIYARLVLAHLPDPLATVQRWRGELAPGGVLLIEDLERVEAPPGCLRHYEELSAEVVRHGGGVMDAGAVLAPLGGRLAPVTVPAGLAAAVYRVNVRRWLDDEDRRPLWPRLRPLEAALAGTARDDGGAQLSWIVRQLVLGG
ncbi:MAG TPA: class I SAM-dependent methyltransferase [Acidimicrobiales bacterium]|nr:class I SAM-dependent methyltransferase [Acidimicrobiales bacterium]